LCAASMSIPARPADAITPDNPTVRLGPKSLKVRLHLPKINGDKIVLFVEGTLFHVNTLAQRPNYHLTVDLSPHLHGLRLDDQKASAVYAKGFLEVYVPLIGSKEKIAEARKWNDPDEVRAKNAQKQAAKRAREEELAQAQMAQKSSTNKKKKGGEQPNKNNKKKGKKPAQKKMEAHRQSAQEASDVTKIADQVSNSAESKVSTAQKKIKSKEKWLAEEKKKMEVKRKEKRIYADTIRDTVKEIVEADFDKKKKKTKKAKPQATKPKKTVQFTQ